MKLGSRRGSFSLEQENYGGNVLKSEESALYREPMDDGAWQQALATIRAGLSSLDDERISLLAHRIRDGIEWLDGLLSKYCDLTCPACEDVCCLGEKVFFNRTDLLYLAGLGGNIPLPSGQTRTATAAPCRYLSRSGCLIPRTVRPYVCVWFLCAPQMVLFQEESPPRQRELIRVFQDIRTNRLRLESLYERHFPQP